MTENEAIEIIEEYKGLFPNARNENESLDIAIKALEKQIPKKPVDKSKNPVDWHIMSCPCCNNTFWNSGQFVRYQPKFCNYCGQAIDWSDTD